MLGRGPRALKWILRDGLLCIHRQRREGLLVAAEAVFAEDLAGRILAFESDAARVFSRIAAHLRALGKPVSHANAQIAAIARVRGAKLATRNVADFEDCGLDIVDPWDGS